MQTQEERIIELETKAAYQEHTIQTLNDVVSNQQKQIDELESSIKILINRLQDMSQDSRNIESQHEKPPHY